LKEGDDNASIGVGVARFVERALAGDQGEDGQVAPLEEAGGVGIVDGDCEGVADGIDKGLLGGVIGDQDEVVGADVGQEPIDAEADVAFDVGEIAVTVEQDVTGVAWGGAVLPPANDVGVVGCAERAAGGEPEADDGGAELSGRDTDLPGRGGVDGGDDAGSRGFRRCGPRRTAGRCRMGW
jgi:hypothetical protein